MDFNHIILEDEQKGLFIKMVETMREIPRENRSPMIEANSSNGNCLIVSGGPNITGFAYEDPDTLTSVGLLQLGFGSRGSKNYSVTPFGYKYYEWLMKQQGKPIERIERNIRKYLELDDFKNIYIDAYKNLMLAEEKLWVSDSQEHFTTIGHLCREAMQEFADQLYINVLKQNSDERKSKDKNRIKEVIEAQGTYSGKTVKSFLKALYYYWDCLSNLVQRQEHGADKEGEKLTWEDARRIVFQSINIMVEMHRTLSK
jgi:hypothetical protein